MNALLIYTEFDAFPRRIYTEVTGIGAVYAAQKVAMSIQNPYDHALKLLART